MAEAAHNLRVSREYGDTIDTELLHVADEIQTGTYYREITQDERTSFGESVIKLSTDIEDKEDEKKATVKMFTEDIKLAKAERKEVLTKIRRGRIEEVDALHTFRDYETNMVNVYNSQGKRVERRKMRPEERQMTTLNA